MIEIYSTLANLHSTIQTLLNSVRVIFYSLNKTIFDEMHNN